MCLIDLSFSFLTGRNGRPHARILRCNDAVTRLYWIDPKSNKASSISEDKSLHLREVLEDDTSYVFHNLFYNNSDISGTNN